MATTPRLALPYPQITDPPDGANQIEDLAVAVDGALQAGTTTIVVTAAATGTASITFPRPFAAPPVVVASPSNSYYAVSVSSITATGCSFAVRDHRGTNNSATVVIQWQAVGQPT